MTNLEGGSSINIKTYLIAALPGTSLIFIFTVTVGGIPHRDYSLCDGLT